MPVVFGVRNGYWNMKQNLRMGYRLYFRSLGHKVHVVPIAIGTQRARSCVLYSLFVFLCDQITNDSKALSLCVLCAIFVFLVLLFLIFTKVSCLNHLL